MRRNVLLFIVFGIFFQTVLLAQTEPEDIALAKHRLDTIVDLLNKDSIDFSKAGDGLHFSIQNPVLGLVADMMSVLVIIMLCVFVYVVMRWVFTFLEGFAHFEHHFSHHLNLLQLSEEDI